MNFFVRKSVPRHAVFWAGLSCAILFLPGSVRPGRAAPSSPPAKPSASAPRDRGEEIKGLIRRLETPAERAALIKQLRMLLRAQEQAAGEKPPPKRSAAHLYARIAQNTKALFSRFTLRLQRLPDSLRKLKTQGGRILKGEWDAWAFLGFGAAIGIALLFLLGARKALGRILPGEGERLPKNRPEKFAGALRKWAERCLPPGALLIGGSLLIAYFSLSATQGRILLTLLWAIFYQQLFVGLAAAALAPERPAWRILPLGDAEAAYFAIWTRRFALVWVWGYALTVSAEALGTDEAVVAALSNLYRFILLLQALILVFQQKTRVRDLLSLREPEAAAPAVRLSVSAWNIFIRRWHTIVVLYLFIIFAIWSSESEAGIQYLVTANLLSAIIVAAAYALTRLVHAGTRRLFAVSGRLKELVPGIEKRANLYTPLVSRILNWLVWLSAALLVLDAWGVPTLEILFSGMGLSVLTALLSIGVAVAVTAGVVEVTQATVEYFLSGRKDEKGEPIPPSSQQRTLLPLGFSIVKWAAIGVAAIIILDNLGVNVSPLLAGAGIAGLALGFGAQSLVKDVITGIFMLIENNISVGDVVRVKDIGGLVEGFNLRSVRLRDYDGNVHVIPNGAIDVVTNFTKEYSRAVFEIGVAYREDVDEVIEVIRKVCEEMRADPEWENDILEPVDIAGLDRFDDSALIIKGRFKTKPIRQWSVRREFHRRVKKAFDECGIEIPFPYRTLTWAESKPPPSPAERPAGPAAADGADPASEEGGEES